MVETLGKEILGRRVTEGGYGEGFHARKIRKECARVPSKPSGSGLVGPSGRAMAPEAAGRGWPSGHFKKGINRDTLCW